MGANHDQGRNFIPGDAPAPPRKKRINAGVVIAVVGCGAILFSGLLFLVLLGAAAFYGSRSAEVNSHLLEIQQQAEQQIPRDDLPPEESLDLLADRMENSDSTNLNAIAPPAANEAELIGGGDQVAPDLTAPLAPESSTAIVEGISSNSVPKSDAGDKTLTGNLVAPHSLSGGGHSQTEAAVIASLDWLVRHQLPDGGWNFDHRGGSCAGRCGDPGRLTDCRTGATALALLSFLGADKTHQKGQYKEVVKRGLFFLIGQMKMKDGAGDLAQGGGAMYSHGLASIVLCEAYAKTHDRALMTPAQAALKHIQNAQDPQGGGWRYVPRQPGDASVLGWQLLALQSGHRAYLKVDPSAAQGAMKFLDSVQADGGAAYGYTSAGNGPTTTAEGLLCRQILGWEKDHPAIQRGVAALAAAGPSKENLCYNFYATLVMLQEGGEKWNKWNQDLQTWLLAAQHKDEKSHLHGSWRVKGDHGAEAGGRLYCTALATALLEIPYRRMPIYNNQVFQDDLPTDKKNN